MPEILRYTRGDELESSSDLGDWIQISPMVSPT